jgi:hypothetical protein
MSLATHVRDMVDTDVSFVYSSWLKSLRPHSKVLKYLFFLGQHRLIESLLARPGVSVGVICLDESPEVILGWICHEFGIVHYLYVKSEFRRLGLANKMLQDRKLTDDGVAYTHHTPAVQFFNKINAVYDPYLLWRK